MKTFTIYSSCIILVLLWPLHLNHFHIYITHSSSIFSNTCKYKPERLRYLIWKFWILIWVNVFSLVGWSGPFCHIWMRTTIHLLVIQNAPLVLSKTDSNWWKTDCLQTYSLDKIWLFSDIFWGFIAKKLTLVYGQKYTIKPWIETTSNCTIFLGFLALFTMFALEIWLFDENLTFIWPVWAQKSVNWLFPEKLTTAPAVLREIVPNSLNPLFSVAIAT